MKLWIDDTRTPPDNDWLWAKTSETAIALLDQWGDKLTLISYDHDLGGDDTAMAVVRVIEERIFHGHLNPIPWRVHSQNPVGAANLRRGLLQCERLWRERIRNAMPKR